VLFIAILGTSIGPAFAQAAGGTDSNQLNENPVDARPVSDANTGTDLLTNRRKPLTADSSLAEVATEDVAYPERPERIMVVKASSNTECQPKIGLSYKDSTPCWPEVAQPPKGAPNVVFIVLDDVGFGQIGCFGGPIETPNIDRLAEGGLRYNNFHTTAMCSPTRACLLTGRNHHSVGIATITDVPTGYPGYYMNLSKNATTLAEILKENGFNTFAAGKWHLAPQNALTAAGPFDNWPTGRGFEKYYGVIGPETNQWYPDLVSGTTRVDPPATPEEGYHVSKDIVDQAIGFISDGQAVEPGKPYFLYLAFTAGHSPHHAPQEYIDMYRGRFDSGWDVVRNETLARQKAMGIVPENTELSPRTTGIPAWDDLSADQKRVYAREQEVYAGFLTHTDAQIGRFLNYLEGTGQLNNTMIVFISDNGASMEGGLNGTSNFYLYMNGIEENLTSLLSQIDELGGTKSYPHYAIGWAMAGNTPFKRYKQNTHEGGIRDPMIVYYPALIEDGGAIREHYTHAIDVVPTVLEVLGLEAPEVYNGHAQKPIEGISFAASLTDPDAKTEKYIQYSEMFGNRALWYNGWKATAYHKPESGGDFVNDTWELYNTTADVSEVHNLASEYPLKLQEMIDLWFDQAGMYNVLPLDDRVHTRASPYHITGVFTYLPGIEKILDPMIPDTKDRSFNITAYVDMPKSGAEGVLFSIGGRFGGLSLFVEDRHLVYEYNSMGVRHYNIVSDIEVPTGPSVLKMAFDKKSSHRGVSTLYINGEEAGSIEVVTQSAVYSFEEGLEVGRDPQTPVTDSYESPFEFNGTLEKVVLDVKG
jgi:arylsulfatase